MYQKRSPGLDRKPRVLELGSLCLFKQGMPEQTTLIWAGKRTDNIPSPDYKLLSWPVFRQIRRSLASGAFDLIACYSPELPLWREAGSRESLWRRLLYDILIRYSVPAGPAPLVILDYSDRAPIRRHNHHLLNRASWYFKRELPLSREELLLGTAPWFDSADTVLRSRLYRNNEQKLFPTSLGMSVDRLADVPEIPSEKTTDIFFSGRMTSDVRRRGLPELLELSRFGIKVDVPPALLPRKEFYERCARAWLAWSPEGLGWDCFRHYESSVCRSVPVLTRPRITWHRQMKEGVHCFFYEPSGAGLAAVVKAALSDKEKLRTMAEAGREQVLRYHTHRRICGYILQQTIGTPPDHE
jgi:hypothetical protein